MLDGADASVFGSRIPRFELQFPAAEIEPLAARFAYADDERCRDAGAAARARGSYTRAELLVVCAWKTPRSASKGAANNSSIVASVSRAAFATTDEAERMSALLSLSGVGVPTASALLMFAFPDDYPILDVRALQSLGVKPRPQYPIGFWLAYLERCRELARGYGVHIRTLDKALWQHSKDRSVHAKSAASQRHRRTDESQSEPAMLGSRDPIGQTGFSQGEVYDRALVSEEEGGQVVIDRLREQIHERLDQLAGEAERLRKALAALDPRSSKAPARKPSPEKAARTSAPRRKASPATTPPAALPTRTPRRTASGTTRASVLAALAGGEAMTASEVAAKAGIARPTVSTTLSKLAKSGEVQKAPRGYQLSTGTTPTEPSVSESPDSPPAAAPSAPSTPKPRRTRRAPKAKPTPQPEASSAPATPEPTAPAETATAEIAATPELQAPVTTDPVTPPPALTTPEPTAPAPISDAAPRDGAPVTASPQRTPNGTTTTAVLAALAGGEAMTASEVAAKAGLPRPTVSTTLSRLAKSGAVEKAERGYRLRSAEAADSSVPEA